MSYNYPTYFGQGAAPQFYKPAASFSPTFGASSGTFATAQGFGNQSYSAALPTWFGAGPAPEYYRPAEQYKPFEHGAGVHAGFHSGLQSLGFQGGHSTLGFGQPAQTFASNQFGSAFPTWFGSGTAPEFYKAPAQFDLGYGQFGGQVLGGQVFGGQTFGGHSLAHVVGHSGLGSTVVGGTSAYPTWFGAGNVPEFYKQPAQFDQTFGQFAPQAGISGFQGHQGHTFIGGIPAGVDAQHHRLMNELRGFQWVGHGFHSGLRGPGALVDSATGPRDLPQDPQHSQLMQEVRQFESHDLPGQHPGLKGSGTAIDQASGPKDLPDDPSHKQLMEEVRKHSQ